MFNVPKQTPFDHHRITSGYDLLGASTTRHLNAIFGVYATLWVCIRKFADSAIRQCDVSNFIDARIISSYYPPTFHVNSMKMDGFACPRNPAGRTVFRLPHFSPSAA
jgi:hypothetical protein